MLRARQRHVPRQVYEFSLNVSTENSSYVYGLYRSDIATVAIQVGGSHDGANLCHTQFIFSSEERKLRLVLKTQIRLSSFVERYIHTWFRTRVAPVCRIPGKNNDLPLRVE